MVRLFVVISLLLLSGACAQKTEKPIDWETATAIWASEEESWAPPKSLLDQEDPHFVRRSYDALHNGDCSPAWLMPDMDREPQHWIGFTELGIMHDEGLCVPQDADKAAAAYMEALSLNPVFAPALGRLGRLYAREDWAAYDPELSEAYFRRATLAATVKTLQMRWINEYFEPGAVSAHLWNIHPWAFPAQFMLLKFGPWEVPPRVKAMHKDIMDQLYGFGSGDAVLAIARELATDNGPLGPGRVLAMEWAQVGHIFYASLKARRQYAEWQLDDRFCNARKSLHPKIDCALQRRDGGETLKYLDQAGR